MKTKIITPLLLFWRSKEAWIWLVALIFLASNHPGGHHYSFCLFNNLGISFCPGCGIGRSITLFFNGSIKDSFLCHPLGIPAVILLSARIYNVLKNSIQQIETINPLST